MIGIAHAAGAFAGDKDVAAKIRDLDVLPRLRANRRVTLDFTGVEIATQSFVHTLLAAIVRDDPSTLDRIDFKGCSDDVQQVIEIVTEYAQEEF